MNTYKVEYKTKKRSHDLAKGTAYVEAETVMQAARRCLRAVDPDKRDDDDGRGIDVEILSVVKQDNLRLICN